jgi:hypothetical protein
MLLFLLPSSALPGPAASRQGRAALVRPGMPRLPPVPPRAAPGKGGDDRLAACKFRHYRARGACAHVTRTDPFSVTRSRSASRHGACSAARPGMPRLQPAPPRGGAGQGWGRISLLQVPSSSRQRARDHARNQDGTALDQGGSTIGIRPVRPGSAIGTQGKHGLRTPWVLRQHPGAGGSGRARMTDGFYIASSVQLG